MSNEKEVLSGAKEFELRGNVTIKVYPASFETITSVAPKVREIEKLDKGGDIEKQVNLMCDVIYDLIKEDNEIKKEQLRKILTLEAAVKIMQKAVGAFGGVILK